MKSVVVISVKIKYVEMEADHGRHPVDDITTELDEDIHFWF